MPATQLHYYYYYSHPGCPCGPIRLTYFFIGDANRPEFKEFARLIKDAKPVTTSTLAALFGPEASPQ